MEPVTDRYHGVSVVDPYRWLEASDDARVREWTSEQNRYARSYLDALPGRDAIAKRVREVYSAEYPQYRWLEVAANRWFVSIEKPPAEQPFIAVLDANADPSALRVLLDPNQLDPSGKTAIDWFKPSPDGKLLAVSLSQGGTELGDVNVYLVESGKRLDDSITRVNGGTAGGDLAWAPDGSGFYYTRYPRPGERPPEDLHFYQQVYFHRLGTPEADDRYEIGRDFPRIAECQLDVDAAGRVLLTVQHGDGGEFAHYLRETNGVWRQFSKFGDQVIQAAFIPKSKDLFAISRARAELGELIRIDAKSLDRAHARVVVPATEHPLVTDFWGDRTLLVTGEHVYLTYQLGGPTIVRRFDHAGSEKPLPMPLEVASFDGLTSYGAQGVLLHAESFVAPAAWYRLDEKGARFESTALADRTPFDPSSYRVTREFAVSKDGTKVPVSVLLPPGVELDGTAPAIATGYGGYGVSIEPHFRTSAGLWMERGLVVAVANLRGGGEYGSRWHREGNLTHKQNVFDDFAAVLEHLITRKYANEKRLGIIGGSNGGLLMGATLVQHPSLVRAVVSFVGIYDMLRVELSPNGAFNVTEFGSVRDPAQFEALRAYSPYHNVRDGEAYPPVLLLTGENDPRVDPMQSRKMAARLQAASSSGEPVLLRTSAGTGHGGDSGLNQRIAEQVDVMTFMLDELRVPVVPKNGR